MLTFLLYRYWNSSPHLETVSASLVTVIAVSAFSILIILGGSEDSMQEYTHLRETVKRDNQILRVYDLAVVNAVEGSKIHLSLTTEKSGILEERDKCSRKMQEIMVAKIKHKTSFMFGTFINIPKIER